VRQLRGYTNLGVKLVPSEELMREYIKTVKDEKRRRSMASVGKVFKMFGRAIPKGVRHPDSLVVNRHLYHPSYRGKTKLR